MGLRLSLTIKSLKIVASNCSSGSLVSYEAESDQILLDNYCVVAGGVAGAGSVVAGGVAGAGSVAGAGVVAGASVAGGGVTSVTCLPSPKTPSSHAANATTTTITTAHTIFCLSKVISSILIAPLSLSSVDSRAYAFEITTKTFRLANPGCRGVAEASLRRIDVRPRVFNIWIWLPL